MSKIRIEFVEEYGIGQDNRCSIELEGDSTTEHWMKAVVGAMTLAGYDHETIMEMFDPCDLMNLSAGMTCSDDCDTCQHCTPVDEADLEEPSVIGAGFLRGSQWPLGVLKAVDQPGVTPYDPNRLHGTLPAYAGYVEPEATAGALHGADIESR